ncbi:Oidioi.mRNA.OKI2018_I69.XSR.g15329.t1.cds [Oikopleura dioica]|uniref:Oidioi.mRNA.OKI2018_I69.XSR.g15329.t1.cds n=1 Tax=Oikopleura dioica TaxID=34765 RepID=A0ABN7SLQ3_OIKDI|nr:Oidioi.mRNA.OKI2018_I69.XSR.g15329.t1.cds [Oikopleura dioica]
MEFDLDLSTIDLELKFRNLTFDKDFFAEFRTPEQKAFAGIYIALFFIGILSNLLVVLVLGLSRDGLKSPSGLYAFHLALANALLIMSLPFAADQKLNAFWRYGTFLCKSSEAIKLVNFFASIFLLLGHSENLKALL